MMDVKRNLEEYGFELQQGQRIWAVKRNNAGVATGIVEGCCIGIDWRGSALSIVPDISLAETIANTTWLEHKSLIEEYASWHLLQDCFLSQEECSAALAADTFRRGLQPGKSVWCITRAETQYPLLSEEFLIIAMVGSFVITIPANDPDLIFNKHKNGTRFDLDGCLSCMATYSTWQDINGIRVYNEKDCYSTEDEADESIRVEQEALDAQFQ